MLVAVSGSQGSGKSTVLQHIRDQGFNTVERKTSRSILDDWGVTLQQVNSDSVLTLKFQDEIIKRKFEDEQQYVTSPDVWFTERTYIDLLTYSIVALGHNNDFSDWLTEYAKQCITLNQSYSMVFYLQAGHFTPKEDGVRGSNHLYSRMVDLVMQDLTQQNTHPSKYVCVTSPLIEQRVHQIITLSTK